ncbi:NAD(P)H-binding protein [Streptococcus loxodontisalivarius]|uniref:Uncharacterized protein YbjT (DUF2867 family) n=1 Tax=Streptococcus loxodontisalivarius TaxID=1349415 RepID=A0ABS2PW19_9STRE|nr:SDR family oxidoreductase [Streptococcus loxodontisalivarius]MBM7643654.1 uncharacterized protein YbjT (DUF2867 family) [Streptococcus loxodontisalivarius]
MTYLITGVTGQLGAAILEKVSETVAKEDIAVLVRSQEKGQAFAQAGYQVRIGDFSDKAQLIENFKGIDRLI